mgnify:CR=1 FL=1
MLFDLEESQGEWFYFFNSRIDQATGETVYDNPVKDARVKIRSISAFFEEALSKRKREFQFVVNPKTRGMERVAYFPELSSEEANQQRDDAWDYAITGLEGFKDAKTKADLKCDRETKLKLMKNPAFDRFIARCFQILASSGIQGKEAEEKN